MVSREIDTKGSGGRSRVMGLLVNLGFLIAWSTISPLAIKLNCPVLLSVKQGRDVVHQVDAFLHPLNKFSLEHGESDVVMATESLVLLEVLDVLFSGVHPHSNILELGTGSCSGIRVTEAGLELVDEILKGGKRGIWD